MKTVINLLALTLAVVSISIVSMEEHDVGLGMVADLHSERRAILSRYDYDTVLLNTVYSEASRAGIDPVIALNLVEAESSYRPEVVSHAGAIGLMQVMYPTALSIDPGLSRADLFEVETNVRIGMAYLKVMLDRFHGDYHLALVAYNMGPTAMVSYGASESHESVMYSKGIIADQWEKSRSGGISPVQTN